MQPLLQWKINKYYIFWVCVSSFSYPAYNVHGYIMSSVACLVLPYFSTSSHKGTIFGGKKLLNIQRVLWFFLQLLSEIFLILRRIEWDMIKTVYWSSRKVHGACHIVMKLEFYREIFESNSNLKFCEHSFSVSWVVLCGRTDGQTDRQTDRQTDG
jgi:hypothetical protein